MVQSPWRQNHTVGDQEFNFGKGSPTMQVSLIPSGNDPDECLLTDAME